MTLLDETQPTIYQTFSADGYAHFSSELPDEHGLCVSTRCAYVEAGRVVLLEAVTRLYRKAVAVSTEREDAVLWVAYGVLP